MSFPGVPIRHVDPTDRAKLRQLARAAIPAQVTGQRPPRLDRIDLPGALWRLGASFVTLRRDAQLRGCIGYLVARRALAVDVAENPMAAATRDPRFPPLAPEEE